MQRTLIGSAMAASLSLVASTAGQSCPADIVRDGRVDGADLGTMLSYWGPRTSAQFSIASDINGDASIDGFDLALLLADWGNCPAPTWRTVIEAQPDPAVVTNPNLRAAISATGLPWRVRDNATGIEMLLVPPGQFQMGCSASLAFGCDPWESPTHTVTFTGALYMGRYEVTQAQWSALTGSNPSQFQSEADAGSRPVERVSWDAAQQFLQLYGLRLPTEAEWEYACRAGTATAFPNGSNDDATVAAIAWQETNSGGETHVVGIKAGNALGLHDMLGNVWEWVEDWLSGYSPASAVNPQGPSSGVYRGIRGGCWDNSTSLVRASAREGVVPATSASRIGFRVARNP